ncbi:MAG: branched-chain amino acid ABC transporter permease [Myxococcaceae bacterium]|nr:MAG: branched-chain amino acid ABC transporter permease [Myxococcaceae bacterium]
MTALLRRHPALVPGVLFAAFLLLAPVFAQRGMLNDLWNMAFFVVLASAWNLLGGFAGQVSLGYSAFVGIGAYTTVLLANAGWSPWLTLPVGAALAVAFSVAVGLPTFRLRGPYFTIATIGVGEAVRVIASGLEFTGGSSGLRMPQGTFDFNANYYAMVGLALLTLALVAWLQKHAFGLALEAIRQDIDAAEALGVHSTQAKLTAHAISAALVAIGGGLFATNFQYISPGSVFDFRLSLTIVLMPIVGGMATITGPVLGALLFSYLQIKLLASPTLRDSYLFIYGGLLIVVMLFEPKGIVGLWERLIGLRPRRRAQPPVGEARRAS